ncbi:hypothetical protein IAR55_001368 [Kwoniella newhampshirensis]|uniref:GTPase activator n=1 Tax=Kwoniella newhampshirensis TaxID=1651941 RepID=A0AAW0Z1Y7_9TREE
MSRLPPPSLPSGASVPSDDWTDDPSFDLSPSADQYAIPSSFSSPSSSTSQQSTSQQSLSETRHHASSPLRSSFTYTSVPTKGTLKLKKTEMNFEEEEEEDFDFDLPAPSSLFRTQQAESQRSRSSTATTSSSNPLITRTIVGQSPTGIGTITRLGSKSSPAILSGSGTLKAKAKAMEKSWEADIDFGIDEDEDGFGFDGVDPVGLASTIGNPSRSDKGSLTFKSISNQMTLSPPKKSFMPPPEALDDLGFDLDEMEDEDQATLKAGATIKAMLPPPRNRTFVPADTQPRALSTNLSAPTKELEAKAFDLELETDFALPLNLTNLTLATQPQVSHRRGSSRPRISNASTANTDWDSPGTSTSGKKSQPGSWESPLGVGNRKSETSVTSVSDGTGEVGSETKGGRGKSTGVDDADDMENGLELPSPTFFSYKRANELNSILDRKRKPQFAPSVQPAQAYVSQEHRRGLDDSFEDGLLLDEPGVEISKHRLREKKRARDKNPSSSASGSLSRKGMVGGPKTVVKERERAWEKQREQGWGRAGLGAQPVGIPKEKAMPQSSLGFSLRSNSASVMTLLRDGPRKTDDPTLTRGEKESMRSRSGHLLNMMSMPPPPAPPPAPLSSHPATSSSTSRLRHQKSHHHMAAPPQSPSITRKQSLASLQDALASDRTITSTPVETPHLSDRSTTPRYHSSTSRLTMPTSSSRAKIRQPISAVFPFPTPTPSSTASSIASMGIVTPRHRQHSSNSNAGSHLPTFGLGQRRGKNWGDGTELDSVDDLAVEEIGGVGTKGASAIGVGKPSRRGTDLQPMTTPHKTPHQRRPSEQDKEKRKKSGSGVGTGIPTATASGDKTGSWSKRSRKKPAGLIKHLGGADKKKVVGEMTWNPATLRWEGNESILQAFDHIPSSTRPALITHYTGSSLTSPTAATGAKAGTAGGSSTSAPAPRIVGDMQFDPVNMRWISILDDESDPFEGMADDEESEGGVATEGGAGGTITNSKARRFVIPGGGAGIAGGSVVTSSAWSSRMISESGTSISASASTSSSWGEPVCHTPSDPALSSELGGVSDDLWKECSEAEERHKKEMRGWTTRPVSVAVASAGAGAEMKERERKEGKRLWEIRHLALKS